MSRSDTRPSFDRSCVTPSSSPARTRMARSNARGSSLPRSISSAPSAFSQELTSSAIVSIVSPLRRYGISSTQIEGAVEPDKPSRDAQVRSEWQRGLQSKRSSRSTPGKAPQQAADRRIEQSRRQPLPADPCSDRAEKLAIAGAQRSEEHTSELQSQFHLVCRLLLEKKKKHKYTSIFIKKKKQ